MNNSWRQRGNRTWKKRGVGRGSNTNIQHRASKEMSNNFYNDNHYNQFGMYQDFSQQALSSGYCNIPNWQEMWPGPPQPLLSKAPRWRESPHPLMMNSPQHSGTNPNQNAHSQQSVPPPFNNSACRNSVEETRLKTAYCSATTAKTKETEVNPPPLKLNSQILSCIKSTQLPQNLNKNKLLQIVNSSTTKFEPAMRELVRQKRLQLSRDLRSKFSCTQTSTEQKNDTIIPDLDIDLNNLPPQIISQLNNVLQMCNDGSSSDYSKTKTNNFRNINDENMDLNDKNINSNYNSLIDSNNKNITRSNDENTINSNDNNVVNLNDKCVIHQNDRHPIDLNDKHVFDLNDKNEFGSSIKPLLPPPTPPFFLFTNQERENIKLLGNEFENSCDVKQSTSEFHDPEQSEKSTDDNTFTLLNYNIELPSNIDELQLPSDESSLFNFTEIVQGISTGEFLNELSDETNTHNISTIENTNLSPIKKLEIGSKEFGNTEDGFNLMPENKTNKNKKCMDKNYTNEKIMDDCVPFVSKIDKTDFMPDQFNQDKKSTTVSSLTSKFDINCNGFKIENINSNIDLDEKNIEKDCNNTQNGNVDSIDCDKYMLTSNMIFEQNCEKNKKPIHVLFLQNQLEDVQTHLEPKLTAEIKGSLENVNQSVESDYAHVQNYVQPKIYYSENHSNKGSKSESASTSKSMDSNSPRIDLEYISSGSDFEEDFGLKNKLSHLNKTRDGMGLTKPLKQRLDVFRKNLEAEVKRTKFIDTQTKKENISVFKKEIIIMHKSKLNKGQNYKGCRNKKSRKKSKTSNNNMKSSDLSINRRKRFAGTRLLSEIVNCNENGIENSYDGEKSQLNANVISNERTVSSVDHGKNEPEKEKQQSKNQILPINKDQLDVDADYFQKNELDQDPVTKNIIEDHLINNSNNLEKDFNGKHFSNENIQDSETIKVCLETTAQIKNTENDDKEKPKQKNKVILKRSHLLPKHTIEIINNESPLKMEDGTQQQIIKNNINVDSASVDYLNNIEIESKLRTEIDIKTDSDSIPNQKVDSLPDSDGMEEKCSAVTGDTRSQICDNISFTVNIKSGDSKLLKEDVKSHLPKSINSRSTSLSNYNIDTDLDCSKLGSEKSSDYEVTSTNKIIPIVKKESEKTKITEINKSSDIEKYILIENQSEVSNQKSERNKPIIINKHDSNDDKIKAVESIDKKTEKKSTDDKSKYDKQRSSERSKRDDKKDKSHRSEKHDTYSSRSKSRSNEKYKSNSNNSHTLSNLKNTQSSRHQSNEMSKDEILTRIIKIDVEIKKMLDEKFILYKQLLKFSESGNSATLKLLNEMSISSQAVGLSSHCTVAELKRRSEKNEHSAMRKTSKYESNKLNDIKYEIKRPSSTCSESAVKSLKRSVCEYPARANSEEKHDRRFSRSKRSDKSKEIKLTDEESKLKRRKLAEESESTKLKRRRVSESEDERKNRNSTNKQVIDFKTKEKNEDKIKCLKQNYDKIDQSKTLEINHINDKDKNCTKDSLLCPSNISKRNAKELLSDDKSKQTMNKKVKDIDIKTSAITKDAAKRGRKLGQNKKSDKSEVKPKSTDGELPDTKHESQNKFNLNISVLPTNNMNIDFENSNTVDNTQVVSNQNVDDFKRRAPNVDNNSTQSSKRTLRNKNLSEKTSDATNCDQSNENLNYISDSDESHKSLKSTDRNLNRSRTRSPRSSSLSNKSNDPNVQNVYDIKNCYVKLVSLSVVKDEICEDENNILNDDEMVSNKVRHELCQVDEKSNGVNCPSERLKELQMDMVEIEIPDEAKYSNLEEMQIQETSIDCENIVNANEMTMNKNEEFTESVIEDSSNNNNNNAKFNSHMESVLFIKGYKNTVIIACEDGKLYKYDSKTGNLLSKGEGHKLAITCFAIIETENDPAMIYSCSLDCTLRRFNLETMKPVANYLKIDSPIQCMDTSWGYFFLGSSSGYLYRYVIQSAKLADSKREIANKTILVLKATLEGCRRVLIVAPRAYPVSVRDAMTGLLLRYVTPDPSPTIYSILLSDSRVYCGTSQNLIVGYDFTNGAVTTQYTAGKGVVCLLMYKKMLFAGCYDGHVYVFNVKTQKFITSLSGPGSMVLALDIFHDKVLIGCKNSKVTILEMPNIIKEEIKSLDL